MKIGYPCINLSIGCTTNSTFRLKNYSERNLIEKVNNNLDCLQKILEFNLKHNLLFFRMSSDIVPFASHPINKFNWQKYFKNRFEEIGNFIKKYDFRISMHPDQFVLLNSPDKKIVQNSIKELIYHCEVLDLMGLDKTAKVQIHVGGVYYDKKESIKRFVRNYQQLPAMVKSRLVIENDERLYSIIECLSIYQETGIPIVFDYFHHSCLNKGETYLEGINMALKTWQKKDGLMITDYSTQKKGARTGTHTEHIDLKDFENYIQSTLYLDFDIMLEIKDKEKSALKALKILKKWRR
ncbi:MAG: UV DNA damage repair endonuclease UvsE [candidate division WOR-3 bacterium]|nr:UV DNA damage repair endonuclease UvsE [candidate division WOR-3 bacterium]